MKKIFLVLFLILIISVVCFADDPKVSDFIGWYIYSFASMPTPEGTKEGTSIFLTGNQMVVIYYTARGNTKYWMLFSPDYAKQMGSNELKVFDGKL